MTYKQHDVTGQYDLQDPETGEGPEDRLIVFEDGGIVFNVSEFQCFQLTSPQIPILVEALRDLGHITEPEKPKKKWKTVGIHGRAPKGATGWVWTSVMYPVYEYNLSDYGHYETRYLLADTDQDLPGWDEVEPAPEPELPAPWMHVGVAGNLVPDVIAYAWALDNGRVILKPHRPGLPYPKLIAWAPMRSGEEVPPHPRAEQ